MFNRRPAATLGAKKFEPAAIEASIAPPFSQDLPRNLNATPTQFKMEEPSTETLLVPKTSSRMDIIKYNVHTPFQHMSPEQCQKIAASVAIPCHLMLYNLDGNMNIAMSVRSAAVLGISDVWIVGKRKYDARPEVGAKNYVCVHKIAALGEDPGAFFREACLQPIFVEQGGVPLETFNFRPYLGGSLKTSRDSTPCFIMGSESHGIPPAVLKALPTAPRITISQYGLVRSLNVSIAASIVLHEFLRQWREERAARI